MKWVFLIIIKLYWIIIPEKKRRSCLFKESCSHYVYRQTNEYGFFKGFSGLRQRLKKCRKGYQLYTGLSGFEMELADGTIIKEDEISSKLLNPIFNKIDNIKNQCQN